MIIGAVDTAVGIIGSLTQHPKDPERRAMADSLYQQAINGNAEALRHLDCLSGSQTYAAEYNALQPPGCGFATESTRAYARGLLAKAKAQLGAGDVIRNDVNPALRTAGLQIVPTFDLSFWLLAGAALVGGYLLIRKA